jgi:hypothetical protein
VDEQSRIRDNPSIKKLLDDVENFARVKRTMPFLSPLLRLLGADVKGINKALAKVAGLSHEAEELARVPDEFNSCFAHRGWILYDRMNFSVAKAAVEKAQTGDIDGAEADLVAHFDAETVRFGLMSMHAVKAFRPRMDLAEKALLDYREGRYHACIPVVLALLDGMVNEVHQKARGTRRGISAEGVDLSAWDSLAAHQTGLNRLMKIVQSGRRKTTTEEIRVPYRNGIMHGIDLGYDNVVVAAKTWALLFATREWAVKAERDELDPPPAQPDPTLKESWVELKESLKKFQALEAEKRRMSEWKPRTLELGRDVPRTGPPEAFAIETPERALAEYLTWWQQRNFGFMARQAARAGNVGIKNGPARVRDEFKNKRLVAFTFQSIEDSSSGITDILAELVMEIEGEILHQDKRFRLVFAGSDGLPAIAEPGEWAVFTWTI